MLRQGGAAGYVAAGHATLPPPAPGRVVEIRWRGETRTLRIDQVFIPPGCEENCIGTVFASELSADKAGS
jgi:hypothetical protein